MYRNKISDRFLHALSLGTILFFFSSLPVSSQNQYPTTPEIDKARHQPQQRLKALSRSTSLNFTITNTLKRHTGRITDLAVTSDGNTLVSGSGDGKIKIWNLTTGTLQRTLNVSSKDYTSIAIAISPNGQTIVSGSEEAIKIWDLQTGSLIRSIKNSYIQSVAIAPDNKTLISGSYDGIKVWDINTGKLHHTLTGNSKLIDLVAISPDGQFIVSNGNDSNHNDIVEVWNLLTGKRLYSISTKKLTKYRVPSIGSLSISPDSKTLVTGINERNGEPKDIILWELKTGQAKAKIGLSSNIVPSVAFSSNGEFLAGIIGSAYEDITTTSVYVWNLLSGKKVAEIEPSSGISYKSILNNQYYSSPFSKLTFSSDGNVLITGYSDGTIQLWKNFNISK